MMLIVIKSFIARDCVFALCLKDDGTRVLCIDSRNKLVDVHERIADRAEYRYEANKRFYMGV